MEYWCHYCREWQEQTHCQSHFESVHGQKGVTFEVLENRLSILGGLETREEKPVVETEVAAPKQPKNWLMREEGDDDDGIIVTNNFRHNA